MCTKLQLERITSEMVNCYRMYLGKSVVSIFLYGSYARGDFDSESDIDIVAIVRGERRNLQDILKKIWDYSAEIGVENDVVISPGIIPYEEFEKYKSSLPYYRNIEKEGKRVG